MQLPLSSFRLLFVILALSACVQKEIVKPEPPPRPSRESIAIFSLHGRAIISQTGKANTVGIIWEHTPGTNAMAFASPLGSMLAEMQSDSTGARWTTADGETYSARSADALMARLTNAPVPVEYLALWVTGQVSPNSTAVQTDEVGRLKQALDNDWVVRVLAYESTHPNALPASIEARRGNLQIRLAIEEWAI